MENIALFILFLVSGGLLCISFLKDRDINLYDVLLLTAFATSIILSIYQEQKHSERRFPNVKYEIELFKKDSIYIKTQEGDLYKRKLNQLQETIQNDNL